MKKPFLGAFTATLDEKNRFVLPAKLCQSLEQGIDELFLVLAKSESGENYIKLFDHDIVKESEYPLAVDSLKLAQKYYSSRVKLTSNHRVLLKKQEIDRLFGPGSAETKLVCVGLGNHIVVTTKTIEKLLENLD